MATGYGIDIWCADSLVTGRYARGKMNVVLALYRRLITPRGTLRGVGDESSNEDELSYGLDLSELIGEMDPEDAVKIVPGRIRAELLKDDRVADVLVVAYDPVYASDGTATLRFDVSGSLINEGDSFEFSVKIENLEVSLLLGGSSS